MPDSPDYWLDTNIFIDSKNRYYSFSIAPGFWSFLDAKAAEGVIGSSSLVYQELLEYDDELKIWARARQHSGLFIAPDPVVQAIYSQICDHVDHQPVYAPHHKADFLRKADPWVVAHAKAHGGTVVTNENLVPPNSTKVKIPNVCTDFGVPVTDLWTMLNDLKASFG
jgi:hypothetical protein